MIIPNKHNGYEADGTRQYFKKGGGSNKAYKQEQQRIAKVNAGLAALNKIFDPSTRQAAYDEQQQAVYDLNKNKADENYADAVRNNAFALARNGLTGGSADVDSQADLQDRYAKSLVEAQGLGEAAAAELRQNDESAKSNLVSLVESGMDTGSASNMAQSALNSNYQSALGNRSAATLSDAFANMQQLYLANKLGQASNTNPYAGMYQGYSNSTASNGSNGTVTRG